MRQFIAHNLRYPEAARAARLEGTVVLRYSINHEGTVVDVQVISSLGKGCDEEAARLAKLLKFEVPKQPGKGKILFHNTLKIHFRLPKSPAEPTAFEYQYTPAEPTPPSTKIKPGSPKKTYTYTINLKGG